MRHVTVDETSSVTSSASSSSANHLFPSDFDYKQYTTRQQQSPRAVTSEKTKRYNTHTKDTHHTVRSTIPSARNASHSTTSPREDYVYEYKISGRPTSSSHRYQNGSTGKSGDKQTTYRTVSFDSGFGADTSHNRLSSLSSDDSGRWREIKPETQQHHTRLSSSGSVNMGKPEEKKFLRKVQRELEDQRTIWEPEVNELVGSMTRMPKPSSGGDGLSSPQGESSYVDTSHGKPIFKAFVDMKGYPAKSITVNVDNLTNKVIVSAMHSPGANGVTRTFTQKIALPRFADDQALTSRLSKSGTLKIEVPLMYYFPQPDDAKARDRKAKSFVYQVEKPSGGADGPRVLEILVNTGAEYRARELKVLVEDDSKLVILGEKQTHDRRGAAAGVQRKLIKQYSLPGLADVDKITSKLGKDGRLQVNVPLKE